jgi:hypothetical protein
MNVLFGRLVVEPNEARFEPMVYGNKLNFDAAPTIHHTDRVVTVVFGWFGLPWMNTGLLLTDPAGIDQFTARLLFPAWQRKTIVAALIEAGFAVEVYRTVFSAGGQIGTATELQRFRRKRKRAR